MPDPHPFHQATEDLGWCATIPHDLDAIVAIYAQELAHAHRHSGRTMTNDEIMSAIASRNESGGSGGHSDPTATAALNGYDDADETIGTIDGALSALTDEINQLGRHFGHPCPPQPATRTLHLRSLVVTLHRIEAHELSGDTDTITARAITETASWLRIKAEGIWRASKGETLLPAVQQTIVECAHCARWRTGTIAGAKGLCLPCRTFQYREQCLPTEAIVRRWEYGQGATPGQIHEAKAAAKSRTRKVKAS